MPQHFVKIDNDEEYLNSKNFISYSCLNYYASRELDSIAKSAYKSHLQNEKRRLRLTNKYNKL